MAVEANTLTDDDRRLIEATCDALGLEESAKTAMLAATPAPIGKGGTNWITRSRPGNTGKLPNYIEQVRNAIMRDGTDESKATQIAIGRIRDWAEGKGNVGPEVKAAAAKAIAEFDRMRAKAKVRETPRPRARRRPVPTGPDDPLALRVELGDLGLLETKANPGVTRWGHPVVAAKLPGNVAPKAKTQTAARTRSGGSATYDSAKHPRTRGGEWTVKQGSSGDVVRVVQRRVGAKSDGQYGPQTRQAVMSFQQRHGLKVDGVVGRQTIAAMRGDGNAAHVTPGGATRADRRWLAGRAAMRKVREAFDEGAHPRDRAGRFTRIRAAIAGLKPGERRSIEGDVHVTRVESGGKAGLRQVYKVVAPGRTMEASSVDEAAGHVLNINAGRPPSPSRGDAERRQLTNTLQALPTGQRYPLVNGQGLASGYVERVGGSGFRVVDGRGNAHMDATPGGAAMRAMVVQNAARQAEGQRQGRRARNLDRRGVPLGRISEAPTGALALKLDSDLRLVETPSLEIHEQQPLALVEACADGGMQAMDLRVLEAAVDGDVKFNADGTVDMVLIRPCHGRGVGNRIYEADMLKRYAPTFAGLAMYDSHESPAAARARQGLPRPPSELAGEVRESWFDDSFSTPADEEMGFERGAVIGRVMLTEDAEKLVRRLPRQIKTSVNSEATGLRPGSRRGKRGAVVEGFVNDPERHSVDLVTRAGAGGAVASLYRELAPA